MSKNTKKKNGARRKKTRQYGGNYMKKALEIAQITPGQISEYTVLHDDWCGFWKRKPCNCDPVFVTHPRRVEEEA